MVSTAPKAIATPYSQATSIRLATLRVGHRCENAEAMKCDQGSHPLPLMPTPTATAAFIADSQVGLIAAIETARTNSRSSAALHSVRTATSGE